MVGKNLNDFIQVGDDSDLCQKAKNVQNLKENPYKDIPSLFSIPIHNRFQILENPTLQTPNSNENHKDKEIVKTDIFYNSKLQELKNELNKRLESRKTQFFNETTEIRNKNSWINFRNRTILLNNIEGKPIKHVDPNDNAAEVCEGIVELNDSQQAKL